VSGNGDPTAPGTSARALVFDCDGVLADTERHGHLPAFNQVFAEFGLPVRWSEEDYRLALRIGGGKERMASLLTPAFVAAAGLPVDRDAQLAEVARWHRRKTEIYVEFVERGRIPARPGIARLAGEARAAGWRLAVCSTSAEASVRAILGMAVGSEVAADFVVLAGDVVARKKPAPDIYELAVQRLGLPRVAIAVVEDSRQGLLAAVGAGLTTIVTVNDYTREEGFDEAALVVTSLGEPDGERTTVVADPFGVHPGAWLTLTDVEACLAGQPD
jgi:HAD superfamily hydrolase (TIGR01509 family)